MALFGGRTENTHLHCWLKLSLSYFSIILVPQNTYTSLNQGPQNSFLSSSSSKSSSLSSSSSLSLLFDFRILIGGGCTAIVYLVLYTNFSEVIPNKGSGEQSDFVSTYATTIIFSLINLLVPSCIRLVSMIRTESMPKLLYNTVQVNMVLNTNTDGSPKMLIFCVICTLLSVYNMVI